MCPVSSVQVTPIGVTTLYSTFSFFRRKKLLHQVGGTKVAQHWQTRYAHLMEILMWNINTTFSFTHENGQLCRYYWWHIVCTILSLPAVLGPASVWPAASLTQFPVTHFHPSGAEAAAASTQCLGRTPCLDSGMTPARGLYLHWYTCHTCPGQAGARVAPCSILRAECVRTSGEVLRDNPSSDGVDIEYAE